MRVNEPITDREIEMLDGQMLVSQTDVGGKIVFASQEFIDISGYSEAELIGAPHNIIRHPHMPKEAFRDLWKVIQTGAPWDGIVKNRAKSGDYYWVNANVTPTIDNGKISGYISIRTKPSRDQIKAAEAAYAAIRNGTDKRLAVENGRAVRKGIFYPVKRWTSTLTGRMIAMGAIVVVIALIVGGIGYRGIASQSTTLDGVVVTSQALRNHMEADMMHDALRADVLAALRAAVDKDSADMSTIEADLEDHTRNFADSIAANKELVLSDSVSSALAEVGPKLDSYIKSAHDIIALAKNDPAAADHAFGAFIASFEELEDAMSKVSDLIEQSAQEAQQSARRTSFVASLALTAAIAVGVLALALVIGLVLRSINRPLRAFEKDFDAIARADASHVVSTPDMIEFARLATRLRAMRAKLGYAAEERRVLEMRANDDRSASLHGMADSIRNEIAEAVESVSRLTGSMAQDASEMSSSAATVSNRSQAVAAAATEALANVQTVAAASEELSASIGEIANQVNSAKTVTSQSVGAAASAQDTISRLSDAVGRINQVTGLISDIASQTNLLALNATIEAARAGEAGKGFAVVAGEVKSLATQTSRATGEISSQIGEVQAATDNAVSAVRSIVESIKSVEQISAAIAAAVDQQNATTAEIARTVTQTSMAAQEVAARIGEVSEESSKTGARAETVKTMSGEIANSLAKVSTALDSVVKASLHDIERRRRPRYRVRVPGRVMAGQQSINMVVENLSEGGAMLRGDTPNVSRGTHLELRIDGFTEPLKAQVRSRQPSSLHVKFDIPVEAKGKFIDEFERAVKGKEIVNQAA